MIGERVLSVALDERDVIVVRHAAVGKPANEVRFPLRTASDFGPLRAFLSRLGLHDVEHLDFDEKRGTLLDPKIVGLTIGDVQPPPAHSHPAPSPAMVARWTPEERERHGLRVWWANQPDPKPPVALVLGDLDQRCPSCDVREAASYRCSACGSDVSPDDWYDWRAAQKAAMAHARSSRAVTR